LSGTYFDKEENEYYALSTNEDTIATFPNYFNRGALTTTLSVWTLSTFIGDPAISMDQSTMSMVARTRSRSTLSTIPVNMQLWEPRCTTLRLKRM